MGSQKLKANLKNMEAESQKWKLICSASAALYARDSDFDKLSDRVFHFDYLTPQFGLASLFGYSEKNSLRYIFRPGDYWRRAGVLKLGWNFLFY